MNHNLDFNNNIK